MQSNTASLRHKPGKRRKPKRILARTFLQGLAVVLPLLVTIAVLHWLGAAAERALGPWIQRVLPPHLYVPGLGIALACLGILLAGLLMKLWLARRLVWLFEHLLARIPLVKTIYGSVRDLMRFLSKSGDRQPVDQVVLVTLAPTTRLLGLVTRESLSEFPDSVQRDEIAVYLPMSYQIGGFTVFVPRSAITPLTLSVEDGLRFAMTAGVSLDESDPPPSPTAKSAQGA